MIDVVLLGILGSALATILTDSSKSVFTNLFIKWKNRRRLKIAIKDFKRNIIWSNAREFDTEQFSIDSINAFFKGSVEIIKNGNKEKIEERRESIIHVFTLDDKQLKFLNAVFDLFCKTIRDFQIKYTSEGNRLIISEVKNTKNEIIDIIKDIPNKEVRSLKQKGYPKTLKRETKLSRHIGGEKKIIFALCGFSKKQIKTNNSVRNAILTEPKIPQSSDVKIRIQALTERPA